MNNGLLYCFSYTSCHKDITIISISCIFSMMNILVNIDLLPSDYFAYFKIFLQIFLKTSEVSNLYKCSLALYPLFIRDSANGRGLVLNFWGKVQSWTYDSKFKFLMFSNVGRNLNFRLFFKSHGSGTAVQFTL